MYAIRSYYVFSFNGNKLVTTGGGGMLITDDESIAVKAQYLSTTAKQPHRWEFVHTEVGYNLRMPSINAAVGFAQLEYLQFILDNKRQTAQMYHDFFATQGIQTIHEPKDSQSNYWLNTLMFRNRNERNDFLEYTRNNFV